ncbi:serine/threonine-protein phosphatase 6 regulatory ankyrin repeat subunit C-like, partial [Saccostrea cucullata]|uniref:serine/threonine-protein phosphatase 6 regulatory ankyrin repeat subunit C-like n=1 Tax=Saccostrea cuccullata TaxID=36930 RepID=UPI002ED35C6F
MSLSKCYTSTPETTNTARLARLILGPCTDVLREILKTEVLPSDLSRKVKEFTNKLPNRQRNPLNKKQSETIFPKQTEQYSGDYSDLDISLLYLLLRNVSKIAPHSKGWGEIPNPGDRSVAANIERIRLLRNQYYGHAADLSQSEPEFRQEWRNIRDIVVELERHLGTTTVFQDAVKEIKTCTMDPEQEKKYINLLGDKTRAFDRVKELLDNQGYVVIKGNPGTGKTTIAKMLMKELMEEGNSPLQLYKLTDLFKTFSVGDDIKNDQGSNALQSAASSGDKHAFNFLLKFGCDPIEKDRDNGHTVLTCACQEGRLNMVKYLVEKYPALLKEHKDIHGGSLLYWAAFSGKIDMFEYMFHLFQNENILHISSDIKHMVYAKDNSGQSILHAACSYGHFDMCEYLLKRYPELLNICDNDGKNVLHYAAQGGNVNIFKYLLSKGLNVNCTTNTGQTVLHKCCSEGREDMCRYLVNRYPSLITVIDNKGLTVLDSACRGGSVAIVSFLIEKEMDIHTLSNEGRSILHRVCLNGKYEICEYLVQKYPHLLDVRDRCSNTELHAAAWGGNVQIIKLLIEKKMDINTLREDGETVLHICCRSGKIEMCEYLVKHYSDLLEIRDSKGWTVLHSACCGGRVEMVFYLIKNKLDLDSLSNNGESILHIACIKGKIEVCEFLIKNYPSLLDGRDKNNNSVLHYAVFGGNVEIVKLLIENKMDKYTREEVGETNLRQCCRSSKKKFCESDNFSALIEIRNSDGLTVLHSACHIGSVQIFSLLLEKGMDINVLSNGGKSVMHIACLNGKLDICKYLVENYPHLLDVRDKYSNTVLHDAAWGDLLEITDNKGWTVLHSACCGGRLNILLFLIEKRVGLNDLLEIRDNYGLTVLHSACKRGNVAIVSFLIQKGLDINALATDGENILYVACFYQMFEIYLLEMRNNEGWTVLHSACFGGSVDIVTFLAKKELHINSLSNKDLLEMRNNEGWTVLHSACCGGSVDIVTFLAKKELHINSLSNKDVKDKSNNTVLHDAVLGGNVQVVKLLIEKKMDVNVIDKYGDTILHKCGRSGNMEMCEYLVNNFSDLLEMRNNEGWTVLHSACCGGSVDIVTFLAKKELHINSLSNKDVKDKSNNTVLHDAVLGGNVQIVKRLIEKKMDVNAIDENGDTILHKCGRSGHMEMYEYL